jgi:hypothetical protein
MIMNLMALPPSWVSSDLAVSASVSLLKVRRTGAGEIDTDVAHLVGA